MISDVVEDLLFEMRVGMLDDVGEISKLRDIIAKRAAQNIYIERQD